MDKIENYKEKAKKAFIIEYNWKKGFSFIIATSR